MSFRHWLLQQFEKKLGEKRQSMKLPNSSQNVVRFADTSRLESVIEFTYGSLQQSNCFWRILSIYLFFLLTSIHSKVRVASSFGKQKIGYYGSK